VSVAREPAREVLLRRVLNAAKEDWAHTTATQRLILIVVAVGIAYEWGIGNEIVTPWLSSLLLDRLGDGIGGALAAAGLVAVFTALQQVAVGWLTLYAMAVTPSVVDTAADAVRARFGFVVPSWWTLPRFQAVAVSFSLGGTFVAVEESLAAAPRRRHTVVVSSVVCATTVFVVVGVIGVLVLACDGTVLEGAARTLMRILSNPMPWCVVAIGPSVVKWVRERHATTSAGSISLAQPPAEDEPR